MQSNIIFCEKIFAWLSRNPSQQAHERQNSTEQQLPSSPAGMDGKWSVTLQWTPWTVQWVHSCSSTQTNIWVLLIRMHKITDHLTQSVLDVCSLFQQHEQLVLHVVSTLRLSRASGFTSGWNFQQLFFCLLLHALWSKSYTASKQSTNKGLAVALAVTLSQNHSIAGPASPKLWSGEAGPVTGWCGPVVPCT